MTTVAPMATDAPLTTAFPLTTDAPLTTGTSGFRNIEGFATKTKAINVYDRKMTESGIITTPTNMYTEKPTDDLSSILEEASNPYFVSDTVGNNTVLYWPSGKNTMICIFPNYCSSMNKGIETIKIVQLTTNDSEPQLTKFKKGKKDDNSDKMMNDYLKWSNYMLKTEVVPPV
jgi:hypothetical protein